MDGNQKLEKWADQLLDTGKRNYLINFKDTKSSTAEILVPESEVLFSKIEGSTSFEVFDPKIQNEPEEDTVSEESLGNGLSKEEFYKQYSPRIRKQSQLLVYSTGGKPISALRTIERRAKDFLEETGVNVAHLAFGFIHWKENSISEIENSAPVLLVPITLSRESAIEPYYIKSEDSEIIVNPTFVYKLDAEYGIKLPEYNDEGLSAYLNCVTELVKKLNWTVTNECKIGIFSFLKINMYQDLKNNAELILKNNNVRGLLDEPVDQDNGYPMPREEVKIENPLIDLHNVIDADSSQIEAIELAKTGTSFVLQGPPGTGKSQTITNIIAECLSDNKKVLFVSEKLAALNVVFDKLKQAGLEDFCLELHSYKSNRKAVIDNLCKTLRAGVSTVSSKAEIEIAQKKLAQQQLDNYARELHKKRNGINQSVYQLYEKYSSVRNAPEVNWHFSSIEALSEDYLRDTTALLRQYTEFVPSVGYNYKSNPWYGYINQDVSYDMKLRTEEALKASKEMLEQLHSISQKIEETFHVPELSLNTLKQWMKLSEVLKDTTLIKPELLRKELFEKRYSDIKALGDLSAVIKQLRESIGSEYEKTVFSIDSAGAHNRLEKLYSGYFSRLFNREYKKIAEDYRLCRKDGRKMSYEELLSASENISTLQSKEREFLGNESSLKDILGYGYAGIDTDWKAFLNDLNIIRESFASQNYLAGFPQMSYEDFKTSQQMIGDLENQIYESLSKEESLAALSASFDLSLVDLYNCSIASALNRVTECSNQISKLENWCQFRSLMRELENKNAVSFINEAIAENIPDDQYIDAFRRRFYDQWINSIIFAVPVLSKFNRIAQDDAIGVFAEKDAKQFEINKAVIRSNLSHNRPSLDMVAAGSAVATLLHEGGKKRKQKSIRKLLTETGELVQNIKPCFLMSPLSVSTFLDPNVIHFDVVIFDEASQIFPQDAVGAIYRADQAIIVGDSRQMPPSNFFNSSIEVMNDDEEEDVTDFESILDLCSTSMKQLRLKWHYRSRYEQLINFSNKNFYDGDLVTFPSSTKDHKGIGIDYFYVNGLFDRRSHTNRKEAEYIVDLVYENIERYPNRSLGVVAFSVAQQNLIENLLMRRRVQHPEKEYFFSSDTNEPFFIKNLETIQGDERDTIIFSVAYGRDSQDRLLLNFGPLSKLGGERRLNVAVTRAKCNVQIVSSMHHTDIDLSRAKSEGARLLREYLDYAENGEIALERSVNISGYDQYDSDFEMEVCEYLRSKGFTVDTQVGCSGYRIDMGLRKPNSSDYVLAIECDGATYHSSRNARDRDRLRQEVLERMGWKFYRIWSTDWFRNKAVEKERLVEAAKKAISQKDNNDSSDTLIQKATSVSEFEENWEKHFSFPKYKAADIDELIWSVRGDYLLMVDEILEIEAPLSEELLMKRTCKFFNRDKVTEYVKGGFEHFMQHCAIYGIDRRNGFLYKRNKHEIKFRGPGDLTREIKYICPEELAAGLLTILSQNVTADKEGLYKTMAEQCGFKRTGKNIVDAFDGAVNYLKDHGFVEVHGNQISIRQ